MDKGAIFTVRRQITSGNVFQAFDNSLLFKNIVVQKTRNIKQFSRFRCDRQSMLMESRILSSLYHQERSFLSLESAAFRSSSLHGCSLLGKTKKKNIIKLHTTISL